MTELPLNEIKGLMVDKKTRYDGKVAIDGYIHAGFNDAIYQQGQRKIRANREKLAWYLFCSMAMQQEYIEERKIHWDLMGDDNRKPYYRMADAISEKLGDILEFVGEK